MPFIAKGATRGASNAQVLSRTHCLRFVMVPAMFARRGQVDGLNWWQSHNSKLQIAHPTTACSRRAARRALAAADAHVRRASLKPRLRQDNCSEQIKSVLHFQSWLRKIRTPSRLILA